MALVKEILAKLGASKEDQELVAEATLDADLKGFTSHGLGRFVLRSEGSCRERV